MTPRYSTSLEEAGIRASVGTTANDSCRNALAENIIGLSKTEAIADNRFQGAGGVESATLEWVDWFNKCRLLSSIAYVPPTESEQAYYRQKPESGKAA